MTRNVVTAIAALGLCACAANYAIYEPPVSGQLATISFVNRADTQSASLATFDDGASCTRRRHIRFDGTAGLPAGEIGTLTVAAGAEFALFASLDTLRVDEYSIDMGVTGGGPGPARSQSVAAIGCNSRLSFGVEPGKHYRVILSEPDAEESCTVVVSELGDGGQSRQIRAHERTARFSSDERGTFCEPLRRTEVARD